MNAMKTHQPRTPWQVTLHVWYAMFMRETMARMSQDRFGPVWLLLEPVLHVLIMVSVRSMLGRTGRLIPGAEFIPWLVVGVITFFLFRNIMNRGMAAIDANRAMFAYRQVHPTDTIFVRFGLETYLQSIVFVLMIIAFTFVDFHIVPYQPLEVILVWLWIALLGLGVALVLSLPYSLIPEMRKVINLITFPLYMLSGVIFPVFMFPLAIREYLMYNPVLHAVELIRIHTFSTYTSVPGIELAYVQKFAIVSILLGLMLQVRFKIKMIAN